jgi:hypothetical protein
MRSFIGDVDLVVVYTLEDLDSLGEKEFLGEFLGE